MRVVGGMFRHRELVFNSNAITRPTKDMVKEGMFSALGYKVNNAIVLDLFAGSGSLGIEAISRGASFCYFVDKSNEANKIINKNISNLNIKNASIDLLDYKSALNKYKNLNIKFDIVLVDPPYKDNLYNEIIDNLFLLDLLNKNAVIVLESDNEINILPRFKKIKDYKYGRTRIKILWL